MANDFERQNSVDRTSGTRHSGGFSTTSSGSTGSSKRTSGIGRQAPASRNYSSQRNASGAQTPMPRQRTVSSGYTNKTDSAKSAAAKRSKSSNKKTKKPQTRARRILGTVGKICLSVFLIGFIAAFLVVGAFGIYMFGFVDDSIDFNLNDLTVNQKSIIYVRDKENPEEWVVYQELFKENREWVDIEKMSKHLPKAFVAAEDQRFYTHSGVDWKRTTASFANMIIPFLSSQQGGSTIDQQLIKNLTNDNDVSPMRKIREIMRARKIDATYSKDVIIECYLNYIYLFNNCYGVEAAAEYYFDKPASDLNIQECASLAAITKEPAFYDPVTEMETHVNRRNWVITEMWKQGYISEAEKDAAVASEVELAGIAGKRYDKIQSSGQDMTEEEVAATEEAEAAEEEETEEKAEVFSYFTDTLIDQLVNDLVEQKGYTAERAEDLIYTGGYKIYTTLDTNIQDKVDEVFTTDTYWSRVYNIDDTPTGGMTIMDYEGHVVAICGGRGEKTVSRSLNHATATHQPGSSMKPVGIYAAGIEDNLITWSTLVKNTTFKYGGTTLKNYDWSTSAPVTVQNALERSLNLVPARILIDYGEEEAYNFATQRFHLSTLVETDKNVSGMALGGSTYGVTTLEMTAAYATFGNGGKYYKPTLYELVLNSRETLDNYKNPVLKYSGDYEQAIGEDTAYIMNQLLRTVVTGSRATASYASMGGWQVIAKTGTTSNNRDRYFVGGTPYYISAVWFGCDPPKSMNSLSSGVNPALRLWKPIFQHIHKDLDKISFVQSSEVKTARYCIHSGLISSSRCSDSTRIGYYKKSYAPVCTGKHIAIAGDEEESSGTSSGTGSGESSTGSGETSSGDSSGTESGTESGGTSSSGGGTSSGSTTTATPTPPASSQAE